LTAKEVLAILWPVRLFHDIVGQHVEVLAIVSKSQASIWLEEIGKAE
jgi:hypothetical protein